MRVRQKKNNLIDLLKKNEPLAVAFSGGVDSAFLLMTARDILGDGVMAFTSVGLPHPQRETRNAARMAESIGVVHRPVPTARLSRNLFVNNTTDRCYQCKKIMWAEIAAAASGMNIFRLADGVCVDDLDDFRPGLAAGREINVMSPLAEAGLTKQEIRTLAREAGLSNWDKPPESCLATRVPYGTRITREILAMIEQAEECLIALDFPACRVRYHAGMARIEIPEDRIEALSHKTVREKITTGLKDIGFIHVAVDLSGYVSGSMNITPRSNK